MASGSSRPQIDQFFPAKKRRAPSRKDDPPRPGSQHGSPGGAKGSLEGYLVRSPSTRATAAASVAPEGSPRGGDAGAKRSLSAAMDVDVGSSVPTAEAVDDGADLELRRFTTDFLSHCCSAIPPLRDDSEYGERLEKNHKRCASQSFLVPCDNASVKKQCVSHCGGLEALKESDDNVAFKEQCRKVHHGGSEATEELIEGAKVSCMGVSALQRCSFTPSITQKKIGFSLAPGETPKSVSRNSLTSPGEDFWNAAMEFADGISAQADKVRGRTDFDGVEDKSSCAVAVCSKTLSRSGKDELNCINTVGSNDTHQLGKLSNEVELLAANSQHKISSPLPVKHLDFFHEDDINVSGVKCEEKSSNEASYNVQKNNVQMKDSGLQRNENRIDPVDAMKTSALDLHSDSADIIHCQGVFKSTTKEKVHSTREGDKDFHHQSKSLAAYSNGCKAKKDFKSKFVSQEVEASTPTSSVPLKDYSKLSSWLPPELCAVYMKKGISELYPWQVECLLVEGVLEKRNLVYCASTSAGKSFVAEVLMLRRILSSGNMAILVLPYVSICAEKAEHLEQLLEPLGRHVHSFYGNQGGGSLPKDTAVAVCTIEKANSLVNKLLEEGRLSELGVIVIDELHMVGDQHRGYLLELMLTKLRYAAGEGSSESSSGETSGSSSGKLVTHGLQIIGMSATMPNVAAVADWLQAALYQTDFRPVPLEEFIKVGNQIFDKEMNVVRVLPKVADLGGKDPDHIVELCNEIVLQGHSVLLFCSSRKGCESTARHVAKFLKTNSIGPSDVGSEFSDAASAIEALRRCPSGLDPVLEETLPFGVAYHHAGLTVEEREIVESCYRKGLVRVLTATSTLAAGVNLPARRVIFRQPKIGRDFIDGTRYRQMSGRAGRTGIDTKGESVVLDDLSRAREGFVLASDLHLVYLVTPINIDLELDWELYYERFMQLSSLEQAPPLRPDLQQAPPPPRMPLRQSRP
nr:unnamed protein product [Digitaria exilis]